MNRRRLHLTSGLALGLVLLATTASADERVLIEDASFDPETMELTIRADVLDNRGSPDGSVSDESLEVLAGGRHLDVESVSVQTTEQAHEPIAVVLLMNASMAYRIHGDEVHPAYRQQREGFSQFIQRLSGADRVAVVQYREGVPHERVVSFTGDFRQAAQDTLDAAVGDMNW